MWYIIITVVVIGLAIFVKSYRKINRLSEDGTLLVAYTKEAMYKTYLGKDIPVDEQFSKLIQACCLFNNFLEKTKGMRGTYSFSILENGPVPSTVSRPAPSRPAGIRPPPALRPG